MAELGNHLENGIQLEVAVHKYSSGQGLDNVGRGLRGSRHCQAEAGIHEVVVCLNQLLIAHPLPGSDAPAGSMKIDVYIPILCSKISSSFYRHVLDGMPQVHHDDRQR